jgi:hypothetical protein
MIEDIISSEMLGELFCFLFSEILVFTRKRIGKAESILLIACIAEGLILELDFSAGICEFLCSIKNFS